MEDDREKVLASIRRRLRGTERFEAARSSKSPLLAPPGRGFDSLFEKFKMELSALGGEAVSVETELGAADFVAAHSGGKDLFFVYDDVRENRKAFTGAITGTRKAEFGTEFDRGYDKQKAAGIDCAVSGCLTCVAETGTVVLNTDMRLPAALAASLFVIADREQLLPSLDELFTDGFSNFQGSNLFLITGPSRTADIEKQLVKGVHGPKEVYVVFLHH